MFYKHLDHHLNQFGVSPIDQLIGPTKTLDQSVLKNFVRICV